jgi:hypothetical protein
MFIARANAASLIQHLLSPFSSPFFGVKLLYHYGFWGFRGGAYAGTVQCHNMRARSILAAVPPLSSKIFFGLLFLNFHLSRPTGELKE